MHATPEFLVCIFTQAIYIVSCVIFFTFAIVELALVIFESKCKFSICWDGTVIAFGVYAFTFVESLMWI